MPENSHLHSTDQVTLGLSQCGAIPANRTEQELETHFTLVFPLSGVFGVNTEGTRISATPAKAVLFSRGQARQIHHPFGGHDKSVYISMKSRYAEAFLDRSGRFRVEAGKTNTRLDYRLRGLIASAKTGYLDALELEEFTVSALADLMEVRSAPANPQPARYRARHRGISISPLSRALRPVDGRTTGRLFRSPPEPFFQAGHRRESVPSSNETPSCRCSLRDPWRR